MKFRSDPIKIRLSVVMVGCLVLGGGIAARASSFQILRDERLAALAHKQFQSKVLVTPRRGLILDRTGEALAVNVETHSLAANPVKIRNKRTLARLLAKAGDGSYLKLLEKLSEKREFVWIKRHMSDGEMERYRKWHVVDADGTPVSGLWIVKESKRVYPHGDLAAHVLGDVNLDSEGLEGIELLANDRLRGKTVSINAEKDALGRPTFIDTDTAQRLKDGEPVSLTIDSSLQYGVEEELHNAVIKHGARGGAAIVMNAESGEVLAIANEPSFDPNAKGVPAARRRNRAVTDGYEPGSTMKAVLLATALSNGMKLTDQVWGERGSFVVQGKKISEAETHERFEWLTLKKLIQVSSNVGAAKLALKLGGDRYLTGLKNFGFGARTGIDFPGEINGRLPPRKVWPPLTVANVGFGQGILVTPIQMLRAYAAFANGGWLVRPKLLQTQLGTRASPAEVPKRILSQKVRDQVVEALKSVTEEGGTGIKARLEGYVVAGKTGTAQEVDPGTGRYSRSRHVASFIGFAVGAEPNLVIFTSIEDPRGVYYASETAAPLFSAVLNAAANRFSLPSQNDPARKLAKESAKSPLKGVLSDRLRTSLAKVVDAPAVRPQAETLVPAAPAHPEWVGTGLDGATLWKMPSLRGLTAREALQQLKGRQFQVEVHGTGIVRSQQPEEGKAIADGAVVRITLAEP